MTFAPGTLSTTVRVAIENDDITEMIESFQVMLSAAAGSEVRITASTATVDIIDADG